MPRKRREVPVDDVKVTVDKAAWEKADALAGPSDGEIYQRAGNKEVAEVILEKLATVVDIPDDKPSGISLRDQAVLHLLAGADLHRVGEDVVEHRINRCISIANLVVKMLGEDA